MRRWWKKCNELNQVDTQNKVILQLANCLKALLTLFFPRFTSKAYSVDCRFLSSLFFLSHGTKKKKISHRIVHRRFGHFERWLSISENAFPLLTASFCCHQRCHNCRKLSSNFKLFKLSYSRALLFFHAIIFFCFDRRRIRFFSISIGWFAWHYFFFSFVFFLSPSRVRWKLH